MTEFTEAYVGILELYGRYIDAVWRKDSAAFGDCFTEDGEWRIGAVVLRGRAEIEAQISGVLSLYRRVLATMRPPTIEVGEGTATARTYFTEECIFNDGRVITPIGIYYDRFVQQGTRWRFSWRLFQTQYAGPADLSGPFFDNPEFGPPPVMPPIDQMPIDHTGTHRRKALET